MIFIFLEGSKKKIFKESENVMKKISKDKLDGTETDINKIMEILLDENEKSNLIILK